MSNPQMINSYIETELSRSNAESQFITIIESRIEALKLLAGSFDRPERSLLQFTKGYINSVPKYLCAYQGLTEQMNIETYVSPFLNLASSLFLAPHPTIDKYKGFQALLYRAYLSLRMLEEINDRVRLERKIPLVPIDLAHTNLIAHTIIGDINANALDQTILIQLELANAALDESARACFNDDAINAMAVNMMAEGWQSATEKWPILLSDLSDLLLET